MSAPLWVDAEAAVDSGGRLRRERVHLVYQYARFAVGEIVACSGLRPIQTGDRFVAFVANRPQDTDGALIIPDDLFIEASTGGVSSNEHWMSLLRRAREDAPRLDTVIKAAKRSELKRKTVQ